MANFSASKTFSGTDSYFHIATADECFHDCEVALKYNPRSNTASQQCILNRRLNKTIIPKYFGKYWSDNNDLLWFKDTYAADELCCVSYLS
jgi:hypothetical protein